MKNRIENYLALLLTRETKSKFIPTALISYFPLILSIISLISLWVVGQAANNTGLGFRLDDAWIHLVYAQSFAENGFLSYSGNIPSTGSTSPLWSILLSINYFIFHKNVDHLITSVFILGAILHITTIYITTKVIQTVTNRPTYSIITGSFLTLCLPYTISAFSGMEVHLTAACLLGATLSYLKNKEVSCGIFMALACASRPESVIFCILIFSFFVYQRRPNKKTFKLTITLITPSIIIGSCLFLYNYWASGLPLPATFYAKNSSAISELPSRLYTAASFFLPQIPFFTHHILGITCVIIITFRIFKPNTETKNLLLIALGGLAFLSTNLHILKPVDPYAYYHMRYLMPAVPLLFISIVCAIRLLDHLTNKRYIFTIFTVVFSTYIAGTKLELESYKLHNDTKNINEVQRHIGLWLKNNLPKTSKIAVSDAGALRYFSELDTIDVLGLNTPEMLTPNEDFINRNPVSAIVLIPSWFTQPPTQKREGSLTMAYSVSTSPYTVTSFKDMNNQVVLINLQSTPIRSTFYGPNNFSIILDSFPR